MKWQDGWRVMLWLGLLAFMGNAGAQSAGAVRKQLEASLLVQGEIVVDEQGLIADYTIKDPHKLPQGVEAFVRKNVANWSFDPPKVEGRPVRLRNDMSLLLVARKLDANSFLMRVQAASFYPQSTAEGYGITRKKLDPPRYPTIAAEGGAQAMVYLVLKIGRDGRVQDVVAEQVNLRVVANGKEMRRLREKFAEASIAAARQWEFTPPTRGNDVDTEFWSVRVPLDFSMFGAEQPSYGRWVGYIPGPREKAPWLDDELADTSPEAMMAGEPQQLGKDGLRLRTPLGGEES